MQRGEKQVNHQRHKQRGAQFPSGAPEEEVGHREGKQDRQETAEGAVQHKGIGLEHGADGVPGTPGGGLVIQPQARRTENAQGQEIGEMVDGVEHGNHGVVVNFGGFHARHHRFDDLSEQIGGSHRRHGQHHRSYQSLKYR